MRLSSYEVERVLQLLPELYTLATPDRWFATIIELLRAVVDSDRTWILRGRVADDHHLTWWIEHDTPPTPADVLQASLPDLASCACCRRRRPDQPVILPQPISCDPVRARRDAACPQHVEAAYELLVPVSSTLRNAVAIVFHRDSREFTSRDGAMMTLLQPHLRRAYQNALRLDGWHARAMRYRRGPRQRDDLTDREAEVAFWIGQGKTNGEIAAIVRARTRTVEKHVEHLLAKLGVENRTAAALAIRSAVSHGSLQHDVSATHASLLGAPDPSLLPVCPGIPVTTFVPA